MRTAPIIPALIFFVFSAHLVARGQDLDKELSNLGEQLASAITEAAKKKVTVIDFTDLQGGGSELGKYIAEQLTVDLVTGKRSFTVLDRANRKSIMEEHKLVSEGFVDTNTAKQLGKFAGVDAIILGTITPKSQTVSVTAKIITTDTAEIVGAAKAEFKSDDTVQQLLGRTAKTTESAETSSTDSAPKREFSAPTTKQSFRNFTVELLSFRVLPNGRVFAALQVANSSKQTTIALAGNEVVEAGISWIQGNVLDDNGNVLRCAQFSGCTTFTGKSVILTDSGIASAQTLSHRIPPDFGWIDTMKELSPGESTRLTLEFAVPRNQYQQPYHPRPGSVFKLQTELITVQKKTGYNGAYPSLENIYFDNIVPAAGTVGGKSE